MDKVFEISASGLGLFLRCPLAYKLKYIDKLDVFTGNAYTIYGSAIHKALEVNYKQKIKTRVDLSYKEVEKVFMDYFEKEIKLIRYQQSVVDTLIQQGQSMLYEYMKTIAPKYQPIAVEHVFRIKLGSFNIVIKGVIDLITEDGLLIDHKTTGETTHREWTQNKADNENQFTIYALAYRKEFKKIEKGIVVDLLKRLKKGPTFSSLLTERNDNQIITVVKQMEQVRKIVDQGLFYANTNNCSDCPFNKVCNRMSF